MPDSLSLKREFVCSSCALLLGLVLGIAAKATDSVSAIGEIGTNLGVWVFVATMVAAFSKTPFLAAINTLLFFLALLTAYYIYGQFVLGFFPRAYLLGWLFIAVLSPACGIIAWFSRGKGWLAIISAALPVALLIAEGYPAYYTFQIPLILDLCCAVVLLVVLRKTWRDRGIALAISCVVAFLFQHFYILNLLPW